MPILNPIWVILLNILDKKSPFVIESQLKYSLNEEQLMTLNSKLNIKDRFERVTIIIFPSQITLTEEQPFHPFIINHTGENIIDDRYLPIDTRYTFTLKYTEVVLRIIKGLIYIQLKNTSNEAMLRKLKKHSQNLFHIKQYQYQYQFQLQYINKNRNKNKNIQNQ